MFSLEHILHGHQLLTTNNSNSLHHLSNCDVITISNNAANDSGFESPSRQAFGPHENQRAALQSPFSTTKLFSPSQSTIVSPGSSLSTDISNSLTSTPCNEERGLHHQRRQPDTVTSQKQYPDYVKTMTITDANGCTKELVFPKALDLDRPKRVRTTFTSHQLSCLEREFVTNPYLVGRERTELAKRLELTETQIKVWYQNRRTKRKKDKGPQTKPDNLLYQQHFAISNAPKLMTSSYNRLPVFSPYPSPFSAYRPTPQAFFYPPISNT